MVLEYPLYRVKYFNKLLEEIILNLHLKLFKIGHCFSTLELIREGHFFGLSSKK